MCTVIVFRNVFSFYPLVVAANRDERYARPSAPFRRGSTVPTIWAPVDLEAGGTWIGVSDRGIFAAILNRSGIDAVPGRTSRGMLPLAALASGTAREAALALARTDGRSFNGFTLVVGDARDLYLVRGDGMGVRMDMLDGRLHVLTDRGIDDDADVRTRRIKGMYRRYARHAPPRPSSLGPMLSFHDDERPGDGACVHSPGGEHGTRASTIIRLDDRESRFDIWHREGPACTARFGPPMYVKNVA